jgi:hypothetical protein
MKGLSKFVITRTREDTSKPLTFERLFAVFHFIPDLYKVLDCLIKELCYYPEVRNPNPIEPRHYR